MFLSWQFVKMKSNTKIDTQLKRKRNPELVETIISAKRNDSWKRVAEIMTTTRKRKFERNLNSINENSKDGETVVIPGKVLSVGELEKKIKVVAFSFSESAKEKILKSGSKISTIFDEIKRNPSAEGVRILE